MRASIQLIRILSSTSIQRYKISYKNLVKQTKQNCNSNENCIQSSIFELDKSENLVSILFKDILFRNDLFLYLYDFRRPLFQETTVSISK